MADETLLTLKQLAAELSLPESTVRYYRDQFIDQIPSVGTGRRRRYPPEAVAILRSIAERYASGGSRHEVISEIGGNAHVPVVGSPEPHQSTLDHVTNLDLLAAILDGEREQRDALYQMAKEIVRITEVLSEQDQVLGEIADRAGVVVQGRLSSPKAAPAALPRESAIGNRQSETPAEPRTPPPPAPSQPVSGPTPLPGAYDEPAAQPAAPIADTRLPIADTSAMQRLRAELDAERQLVERLREAKLQLEHRTAEAEAALGQKGGAKLGVLGRLLGRSNEE